MQNIVLDPNNTEFNYALNLILHTNRPLIYLTGRAGTGKTTFLKTVKTLSRKKMIVLAPTGVAAINAGGQTIHSFFNIAPGIYVPEERLFSKNAKSTFKYGSNKITLIRNLELLIIDEVSMVRCDILDLIDKILRHFRKNRLPFGGVQVLLIGDAFQLPPVKKPEEWNVLKEFYPSLFFFNSRVMERSKDLLYIELKKIYRQKEQRFIGLLNRLRENKATAEDFKLLNSRYNPVFNPSAQSQYIVLATTNASVDEYNESKLRLLPGKLFYYEGTISGNFSESNLPTDRILRLKVGAQVMFRKNKIPLYYNGSIGTITGVDKNTITVQIKSKTNEVNTISLEQETWHEMTYRWDEEEKRIVEEVAGSFTQFPIKLAWAITVHKSQGLTFDHVVADVGAAFAPGQVYVALSRCTSLGGIVLRSKIDQFSIMTDERILEFSERETPNDVLKGAF